MSLAESKIFEKVLATFTFAVVYLRAAGTPYLEVLRQSENKITDSKRPEQLISPAINYRDVEGVVTYLIIS